MSALLFNPRAQFDFDQKPKTTKKPHSIINIGVVGFIFVLLMFSVLYQVLSLSPDHSHISLAQYNIKLNRPTAFNRANFPVINSLPTEPLANYSTKVPILMYHYTPANFEAQLQHLQSHGYTAISMGQLSNFLYTGGPLPTKPVVITFDDGFEDQLHSFELLKKYQMKATFYIILGGEDSNHCIGLTRTNLACGDSYLNWSQVKQLEDSGLIEIGAHTLNHADLPILNEQKQWQEITESKKRLEDMYNITVSTFAYPYGRYDQTTINLVKKAGFFTAVTTQSETVQTSLGRYTLPRVRDALLLP